MLENLSDKQLERIAAEANKEIRKKYPLLHEPVLKGYIPYILRAYEKVVKRER